jgi:hypothetical protein
VTLFDVYECAINPDQLARKITEGEQKFPRVTLVHVHTDASLAHPALAAFTLHLDPQTGRMTGPASTPLREYLEMHEVPYDESVSEERTALHDDPRREQFEAVKRWFDHDWRRIEPKLRTSIVEGISVFLSLFDDSPAMKRVFCPPNACYDPDPPKSPASVSGRATLPETADGVKDCVEASSARAATGRRRPCPPRLS